MRWLVSILIALVFGAWSWGAFAAPSFPALSGRVVDAANDLPPAAELSLTGKLATLEAQTSRQLVIVTLPSLQGYEIEDYGYQLGRAWGIGQSRENNGVLLIVAPSERRVRIEIGYGLEGVLTDAMSSVILQQRVLPKLGAGDIEGGVVSGADALIEQLSLPPDVAAARVAAVSKQAPSPADVAPLVLVFLFVLWIVGALLHGGRGSLWAALPFILLGGRSRHGGRGGFGGGAFRGGGGSFGGGGASGRW